MMAGHPQRSNLMRYTGSDIWTALPLRFASRIAALRHTRPILVERQIDSTTAFIVPFSTVTVFDTTIFQTTFVTVRASDVASLSTRSGVRSTLASGSISVSSSLGTRTSSLAKTRTNLPSVITGGPSPNSVSSTSSVEVPAVMTSGSTTPEGTAVSIVEKDGGRHPNKTAIVGDLSGTIAGLLFVGVIICLFLRRRRKKLARASGYDWAASSDPPHCHEVEKGFISTIIHSRTGTAVTRESPAPAFQGRPGTAPAVDEDHRMIRMSTVHWPRPFALGSGEGYRESVPAGQLRCTNPDSRPGTPQTISNSPQSFFSRQRSLLRREPKSQPQQRHPLAQEVSTIKVVDPALSRECISRYSNTPSFKSYPSISTQVVHQRAPDDLFLTPTAEEPGEITHPKRPSAARTITAASKTWAQIKHPLRNRSASNLEADVRVSSHYSVDTTTSSARYSRRSDPFDLDRQSRNWNAGSEGRPGRSQTLYEGT